MKLAECADILRSKNAGPFCLSIDLLFVDKANYEKVKKSGVLSVDTVSKLYQVDPDKVKINFFDSANGIKVAFPREYCCGCYEDNDCYGAQQHMPLMDLEI